MAEGKTITLDDSLDAQEVEKKIHNTVKVKYRVKRKYTYCVYLPRSSSERSVNRSHVILARIHLKVD